jgi:hypothetical protein
MKLQLLDAVDAANDPPASASAGVEIPAGFPTEALVVAKSTAGEDTMTTTLKLWGYVGGDVDAWAPLGTGSTAADRGKLNGGAAIGEVGSDLIRHAERIVGLRNFDRVYLEVTDIGGTDTEISAWLVTRSDTGLLVR